MIPQFEYTKNRDDAWFPLIEGAHAVVKFCNWYFRTHGVSDEYVAELQPTENGRQACIVVDHDGFIAYIKHPIGF